MNNKCNKCGECVHYRSCSACINPQVDACAAFEQRHESGKKICPFERQNVLIGGGECLKEKCAWWSDELKNCIVFAPIFESEASLRKEINTVIFGGVVQGGED